MSLSISALPSEFIPSFRGETDKKDLFGTITSKLKHLGPFIKNWCCYRILSVFIRLGVKKSDTAPILKNYEGVTCLKGDGTFFIANAGAS